MRDEPNTILITGGASGIGRAITEAIIAEGWNAVVADLDSERLSQCKGELTVTNDNLKYEKLDVTDEKAVKALIDKIEKSYYPITGVVNSAGIGYDIPALETELAIFQKTLEVNLIGCFIVAREAGKRMASRQKGSIINISSISGIVGNVGRLAYGASKAGVLNMTKVLAIEWAKFGIRVNAIAPGPIETPLVKMMHTKNARRKWTKVVPQGRYGLPKELAGTAMFLLDDTKSSYITGQTLAVDGGLTIGRIIASDDLL